MRFLVLLAACLLTIRADEYEFWEACAAGDTKEMENLLEGAADIDLDYPDDDGRTPLLLAALAAYTFCPLLVNWSVMVPTPPDASPRGERKLVFKAASFQKFTKALGATRRKHPAHHCTAPATAGALDTP